MKEHNFFSTLSDIYGISVEHRLKSLYLINLIVTKNPYCIDYFLNSEYLDSFINSFLAILNEWFQLDPSSKTFTEFHLYIFNLIYHFISRSFENIYLLYSEYPLFNKIIDALHICYDQDIQIEINIEKRLFSILDKFLSKNMNNEKEITNNIFIIYQEVLLKQRPEIFTIVSSSLEDFIIKKQYAKSSYILLNQYQFFELIYKCIEAFATSDIDINLEYGFSFLTYGMSFEGYDALTEELTQNIHPQFLFNYLHNNIQNINDTFVPVIILLNDYCLAKNEVINELNVEMVNEIVVNILDDGVMNLKEEVIELVINILTFSNYEFITLYVHYEFIDRILDFLQDSDKFCENLYGLIESYLQKTDFQNIDDEKVSEFVMDTIPNFLNATISGSEIVSPRILQKFYPK